MKDVLDFKLGTAVKKEIRDTKEYKDAVAFYEKMDQEKVSFPDANTVCRNYISFLNKEKPFTNEAQLLEFIRHEDVFFQQLLHVIADVSQQDLQLITNKTTDLIDKLYKSTVQNLDNKINERVLIYLSMRYNRRILQNARKCYEDILHKVKLSEQMVANYRWMIIQPYMNIDSYAMSLVTDKQRGALIKIADRLPDLMAYLDNSSYKPTAAESEKLMQVMVDYFINSYIKMIL